MKKYLSIGTAALLAGGMFALAACSSDDAATQEVVEISQVPLEVQVGGVQASTRGIIEGTTLPEESQYGIFAMYGGGTSQAVNGGNNVQVNYVKGVSTLNHLVLLPQGVDVPVYAYYPYNANNGSLECLVNMTIESDSQTDYLWGRCVNVQGGYEFATESAPKVNINFAHAMARVTLRIKKAVDNDKSYKYPYVSLLNVHKTAFMNIYDRSITGRTGLTNLIGKPESYVLSAAADEIVMDFLVIPGERSADIMVNLNDMVNLEGGLTAMVPMNLWESGKQYVYEVTIEKGTKLAISEATITPWDNNPQEGIEVGDNNYVEN